MSVDFRPMQGHWEPSLNVSNGYAHVPCELMRVPSWPSVIAPSELKRRVLPNLKGLKDEDLNKHVREDTKIGNITQCGRTLEDIRHYRDQMIKVVEACIERRTPLVWS